jgi:hypothetical protein
VPPILENLDRNVVCLVLSQSISNKLQSWMQTVRNL